MGIQYGIIYGQEGSPDFQIDAPYDSVREAAVEVFDAETADEMGGAQVVEVHECTVDHVDADWEPGPVAIEIDEHVDKSDIREAVAEDWEWLLGRAKNIESWSGTDPTDVDPRDMPEGAVATTLSAVSPERRSWMISYAADLWKRKAKRWKRQEVA